MRFLVFIILCVVFIACDAGLAPPSPVELGFGGTVYFAPGSWPADSLISLWIFASQVYPLDSSKVYAGLFGNPVTIFLYPSITSSLPFYVDSLEYSFPLRPGIYKYIGVIQQKDSDLQGLGIRVFKVVGFYQDPADPSLPGFVEANDSVQVKGININVDFNNPPPQPF
ncbi:MAG: hypothetical protein JXA06_10690 [Bacteroidetes bacterium]|nr:hypothetical protein [Bacteroidota bacterium]